MCSAYLQLHGPSNSMRTPWALTSAPNLGMLARECTQQQRPLLSELSELWGRGFGHLPSGRQMKLREDCSTRCVSGPSQQAYSDKQKHRSSWNYRLLASILEVGFHLE